MLNDDRVGVKWLVAALRMWLLEIGLDCDPQGVSAGGGVGWVGFQALLLAFHALVVELPKLLEWFDVRTVLLSETSGGQSRSV